MLDLQDPDHSAFVVDGVTYTRKTLLGKGQFTEAYDTDQPGFVLKLISKIALFLELFHNPASYWKGIEKNYLENQSLRLSNGRSPIVHIVNSKTFATDFFMIQERVTPLENLTPKELAPLLPQIKEIFALFYDKKQVLELAKKNLGVTADGRVVVYDLDRKAEMDDGSDDERENPQSLIHCLERSLKSYGPEIAKYLDPRPSAKAETSGAAYASAAAAAAAAPVSDSDPSCLLPT
jgi:hypothetical protein